MPVLHITDKALAENYSLSLPATNLHSSNIVARVALGGSHRKTLFYYGSPNCTHIPLPIPYAILGVLFAVSNKTSTDFGRHSVGFVRELSHIQSLK